jgi:DNA-binding NarL/FixJ family response regulator
MMAGTIVTSASLVGLASLDLTATSSTLTAMAVGVYVMGAMRMLREVARSGSVIDPNVVAALVAHGTREGSSPLAALTDRERDVLEQMAQGRTNAGIAAALHLSDEPQVHRRVAAVLAHLKDASRTDPI